MTRMLRYRYVAIKRYRFTPFLSLISDTILTVVLVSPGLSKF